MEVKHLPKYLENDSLIKYLINDSFYFSFNAVLFLPISLII